MLRLRAKHALLAFSLVCSSTWALTLGTVTVQSSLGEPLKAQIELPDLTPQERATLQVQVGSPADFALAQLPWQAFAANVSIQVQQLADGRSVLTLSSRESVREPFLDLVVQAQSATGRMLRGYTLLFDPPNLQASPPEPAAPLLTPSTAPRTTAKPTASRTDTPQATPTPSKSASRTLLVRPGQTAGNIAQQIRPRGVTLEQMLVALVEHNPKAFIGGNVNRMRSGVVLALPTAEQASAIAPDVARQTVIAHSRDFNAYRQQLASARALAPEMASQRSSSGAIQTDVKDNGKPIAAPDKLTLSRSDSDPQLAAEALRREKAELSEREAEVARNLAQMQQALAAQTQSPPATSSQVVPPTTPAPAIGLPSATAPQADTQPPTSDWVNTWLSHPLALPAAGLLAVLLLLLGLLHRRRQQAMLAAFSDTEEPTLSAHSVVPPPPAPHPREEAGPSTMDFSSSLLRGDSSSDALSEADIFIAYGRYVQAHDILQEAILSTPEHIDLHRKLLLVQQALNDTTGFVSTALTLQSLTSGAGPVWDETIALGKAYLPEHPLFLDPGQLPSVSPGTATEPSMGPLPDVSARPMELPDLDFDFSPGGSEWSKAATASPAAAATPEPLPHPLFDLSLDLDEPEVKPKEDPLETKLSLAQDFAALGDVQGARVLTEAVIQAADGDLLVRARAFLAELG
jgi:pilus assembly protein FimV